MNVTSFFRDGWIDLVDFFIAPSWSGEGFQQKNPGSGIWFFMKSGINQELIFDTKFVV